MRASRKDKGDRLARRLLEHAQIAALRPAVVQPESAAFRVVVEEVHAAFLDAEAGEPLEAAVHEQTRKTLPAMPFGDGEVIQKSAAPVVAAEHRGDDLAVRQHDYEAQVGVAREEIRDRG